jgi:hypothetical protein
VLLSAHHLQDEAVCHILQRAEIASVNPVSSTQEQIRRGTMKVNANRGSIQEKYIQIKLLIRTDLRC